MKAKTNYAAIPNQTLRDKRLSIEARGVLAYLLTHSSDFDLSFEFLQRELTIGRDKLKSIIRELKINGYLSMTASHNKKGNFSGQEWFIFPESQNQNFLETPYRVTEKPSDGKTDRRPDRQTENPSDILEEKLLKKKSLKEKKPSEREGAHAPEPAAEIADEIFGEPVQDQDTEFDQICLAGMKARLGTPSKLPKQFEWQRLFSFWRGNGQTPENLFEIYDLLDAVRKKKRKSFTITVDLMEKNFGKAESLRNEIEDFENGISSGNNRNGTGERSQRIVEQRQRSAAKYEAAQRAIAERDGQIPTPNPPDTGMGKLLGSG